MITGNANDTFDAVEWTSCQKWFKGNADMFGNCGYSYETYQGAEAAPPHLKAIFAHTTCPNRIVAGLIIMAFFTWHSCPHGQLYRA